MTWYRCKGKNLEFPSKIEFIYTIMHGEEITKKYENGHKKENKKVEVKSMLVEVMRINKEEITVVTSLDIAETFGKDHKNVLKDIRELECSEEFSRLNFEPTSYKDKFNREQPMYYITRDGFTLLVMGYTGEKAMKFKEAYIKQFNAMAKALLGKMKERERGMAIRQALTEAIQKSNENERMHGHAYSTYTNLAYQSALGKDAKHLREEYGISKKQELRDYFCEEELQRVQKTELLISGLIEYGFQYNGVKQFLSERKPAISLTDFK